jgi:WD40 repeat protein
MLLSEGHMSAGNVALAAHPKVPHIIVTGGFDGFLKLWDARNCVPVETLNMGEPISCITFKENGESFVLLMNEVIAEVILDYSAAVKMSVKCKSQSKIGKGKINCMRFHPHEEILVAGSRDGNVYALDPENKYSVVATLKDHVTAIDGIDMSVSGKYMRTFARDESGAGIDTKFYQIENGAGGVKCDACGESLYSELKNVVWCTTSSPAAPQGRGTLDSNSNIHMMTTSPDKKLLAVSYTDGNVKLFRHPAASIGAEAVNIPGHSKGKVSVAFSSDGSKLYTAGAQDGVVIVWNCVMS